MKVRLSPPPTPEYHFAMTFHPHVCCIVVYLMHQEPLFLYRLLILQLLHFSLILYIIRADEKDYKRKKDGN